MTAAPHSGWFRRWPGLLSNLLLACLAALLLTELAGLRQPPPPAVASAVERLPSSAPLPVVSPALWQAERPSPRGPDETRLPLTLIGSFRAEPPSRSLVVLSTPDGQVVVRPGGRIMEAVHLVRIGRQALIIDNAGRREYLRLPDETDANFPGIQRLDAP